MDKAKKKRIKRYISWVCMACVVLLLTVMPLLAKNEAEADGPQASILTATAEMGSITKTIHGGGTLEDEDAEDAIIPTGVKITEFLVKNGDIVKAGDPVAKVDKTSVMGAITSVNETMRYLQEELEDGRDEKVDASITAVPGGRVKKIFAKEGESVQEVMLRDGALAVLSIDSMMAVQFEIPSALATGETAEVTMADGTAIFGRVESNLDGKVVITVEDKGYEVGQEVKVEGLGTGTLYIHNAWKATGISGTVSRIYAKEEQSVNAGANLFTIDDRDFTGQLQHRANQHREYEELLQTLLKMYRSGTIDAPCEGIVSGVEADSLHLLAAEGGWEVQLLAASGEKTYQIVFLADPTYICAGLTGCSQDKHDPDCILACEKDEACKANVHKDGCYKKCSGSKSENVDCTADKHENTCIESCVKAKEGKTCQSDVHYKQCIESCDLSETCGSEVHFEECLSRCVSSNVLGACPAKNHRKSCISRCKSAAAVGECEADEHHHKQDCIESCILSTSMDQQCPASVHKTGCEYEGMVYTATAAYVKNASPKEGLLQLRVDPATVYNVKKGKSGWELDKELVRAFTVDYDLKVANASRFGTGDIILMITCTKNGVNKGQIVDVLIPGGGTGSGTGGMDFSGMLGNKDMSSVMSGMSGMQGSGMNLSGMMGGFSGYGNYSGAAAQEMESLHDREGSPLLTVTPHRTMNLTISLDEQDISRIRVGMKAAVKVEALKNQEFPATITKVGMNGTNSGGSSKFEVRLRLEAAGDMLPGMSASATIPAETKENVLTIPVEALIEQDGKSLVYRELDKDSGEPSSPVEVVTGMSDGKRVEILSGLSQGDTVYYSYYDILELDTSAEAQRFTFG